MSVGKIIVKGVENWEPVVLNMGLAGLLQQFVFFIDIAFNIDDHVKMKNTF